MKIPIECFRADLLRFFSKIVKSYVLGSRMGTRHQIQAFQVFP